MASELRSAKSAEIESTTGQPAQTKSSPHIPPPRIPKLTQAEISVLEECNTESFWYRCVPLAAAFGGTTVYLVRTGHLKPNPRYGATLKTLGAMSLAYILGKFSYQRTCQQKILDKIPNSSLAQSVRKSRGMVNSYDSDPGDTGQYIDILQPSNKAQSEYSSINLSDSSSRNVKELDDSLRPSIDREVILPQGEDIEESQRSLTYNELRARNRQEYEHNMTTSTRSPFRQRPFSALETREGSTSSPEPLAVQVTNPTHGAQYSKSGAKENNYGDVWDV